MKILTATTHNLLKKRFSAPLLTFILLFVLSLIVTQPLILRLNTHVPQGGDTFVHLWTFSWVKQALLTNASLYQTELMFYPSGVSLFTHNIAWLQILLWLPLQALIGEISAYNLMLLLTLVVNGFTAYLFAREHVQSETAAFVAGTIVAFWPYLLSHSTHPNGILIAPTLLTLLLMGRLLKDDGRSSKPNGRFTTLLLTAFSLALIGIGRWQHIVIGGILITAYVLYLLIQLHEKGAWRALRIRLQRLLAAGVISIFFMAPFLAPVIINQLTRAHPEDIQLINSDGQTDLLAYIVPSRYHPIWGKESLDLYKELDFFVNLNFVPFIGYTTLILAIIGIVSQWRRTHFWLWLSGLYVILALGPDLRIRGEIYDVPMLYRWLEEWALIQFVRRPDRFNYILCIPIALLAAWGVFTLQQKWPRWKMTLTLIPLALILTEYMVELPTHRLEIPAWYQQQLAQEPEPFGILGIPMRSRGLPDKLYMYYQRVHDKAIVGGHVSRQPRESLDFINNVALLTALQQDGWLPPDLPNVAHQLRQLSEANIRYIILHKELLEKPHLNRWQRWLSQTPLYEDEELIVYTTAPKVGQEILIKHPLLTNTDNAPTLGLVDTAVKPTEAGPFDLVKVSTRWATTTDITTAYIACLTLLDAAKQAIPNNCQPIAATWPITQWRAHELVDADPNVFSIDPYLNAGTYTVTLSLQTDEAQVGQTAVVGTLTINAAPRNFEQPRPQTVTDLVWDGTIALQGYDLSLDNESLNLTLYWYAQRRMNKGYKLFLHLTNPETQDIVAQIDTIPRNWTYPTILWEQGQFIDDTLTLPLTDVPPGQYTLFIGWYDEATGERLTPVDSDGLPFPNNTAPLVPITR